MDRKMIFVLLLSGYIFTKPAATQTIVMPGIHISPASPASAISTTESPVSEHIVNRIPPEPRQELQYEISQSVMVVIIFAVIAGVIGIIVGSAILIKLLKRRHQEHPSTLETSETPKQTEGTEDPEQQPMTGDSTIQASEKL